MSVAVAVAMVVAVTMVMMMGVGLGWNHARTLYYNITCAKIDAKPFRTLGFTDQHGDGCGQEGKRDADRGPKPDEPARHERDFPEQQPLEGE